MCRSIHTLFNLEPSATDAEMRAAALQFVRKVTGYTRPSQANAPAFDAAVDAIAGTVGQLVATMSTTAPARDRAIEAEKARLRARARYG